MVQIKFMMWLPTLIFILVIVAVNKAENKKIGYAGGLSLLIIGIFSYLLNLGLWELKVSLLFALFGAILLVILPFLEFSIEKEDDKEEDKIEKND